jgi:hypothetical protein
VARNRSQSLRHLSQDSFGAGSPTWPVRAALGPAGTDDSVCTQPTAVPGSQSSQQAAGVMRRLARPALRAARPARSTRARKPRRPIPAAAPRPPTTAPRPSAR